MRALSSWLQICLSCELPWFRVHSVPHCLLKREERAAMKHYVSFDLDLQVSYPKAQKVQERDSTLMHDRQVVLLFYNSCSFHYYSKFL